MRSQNINNGSLLPPSSSNIPFNFIVSEGGFTNSKGIKIAAPVIFDPAAGNTFIQDTLVKELGWDLISGRYLSRYVISIYFEITLNHLPIKRSISIKTILTKFRRHATHDK